ncbi:MAG TPA: hypothetical protein VII36_07750, partial [Usitatibacter sp.]
LSLAGRGAEAARLYLDEARSAPEHQRVALERSAASQLLFSGQIDEGTRLLRRILARSGRGAPSSTWTAVGWLVFYAVWLRIRGLRVEPREPEELPPAVRAHLEAVYVASVGLAMVDALTGASLVVRLLTAALHTGHRPALVGGGLLRAAQLATVGRDEGAEERALLELVDRVSERDGATRRSEQSMRSALFFAADGERRSISARAPLRCRPRATSGTRTGSRCMATSPSSTSASTRTWRVASRASSRTPSSGATS